MQRLLLKNLRAIVTCDDGGRVLAHADLLIEDGVVRAMGQGLSAYCETFDSSHMLCYP